VTDSVAWYRQVIETEIRPLLDEYWLDDPDKVESLCAALLDGLP
jgi:5-methylcytosine-specific restriction protein B